MTNWTIVAGLMLAATASIAGAKEPKAQPTLAPPSADTDRAVPKARRYCVVDTATGSRIPIRQCRTREEWLAEGFDPLRK